MFRGVAGPQNCRTQSELNVTSCLNLKKKIDLLQAIFHRILAESAVRHGHTHTYTRSSSEVIILEGKWGIRWRSNHRIQSRRMKGDKIIFLILHGSRRKPQAIWALNQIGKRIIRESLKDQYLIKEHKSIAVRKHFSYQFGLIVPDLSQSNTGSRWVYSSELYRNSN